MSIIQRMNEISVPDKQLQRAGILALEGYLKEMAQEEIPTQHMIHAGMYARWVTVKAGTTLTGHIYKYDHIEIMTEGVIAVTTDDGEVRLLRGFNIMPALSGKKRAAHVIEDTTWMTLHVVGNTQVADPEELQSQLTSETFEDLDTFYDEVNRADYDHFLVSQGWSELDVRAISEDTKDYHELDLDQYGLVVRDSSIEGVGLYADRQFMPGDLLIPSRIEGKRTQGGKYINHAVRPNAEYVFDGELVNCVAISPISIGEEITVNYRITFLTRDSEGDL